MSRRPRTGKPVSKEAAKRAADRAEARARGEEPVYPTTPTPLEPFEVSPGASVYDVPDLGWATKNPDPSKGGQPTKYRPEYARLAKALTSKGMFERELADAFGVCLRTIANWKHRFPEFGVACQQGREMYDEPIVHAIAKKAMGFTVETEKLFLHEGNIVRAKTHEYFPPDTAAAKFWLINRCKEDWVDKVTTGVTDVAGKDVDIHSPEAQLQTARRLAFLLTRAAQQPVTLEATTVTDDERD